MHTKIKGQEGKIVWKYTTYPAIKRVLTKAYFFNLGNMTTSANYHGYADCSPQDRFCKSIGRKISLTRLLQNANLTKEERKQVWQDYHNRGNGS